MLSLVKDVLKLATAGISEIFEGVVPGGGFLSATCEKIAKYFESTETIKKYYSKSVDQSIHSLEIALKGPKAYYPKKEQEFYQTHFAPFEKRVFLPFAQEAIHQHIVVNENELRDKCIQECEKIKKVGPSILALGSISEGDIKDIIGKAQTIDPNVSQNMLGEIEKTINCDILVKLLSRENILLAGVVFHFNVFLKSDSQFSGYMNYLEVSEIKERLAGLQTQIAKSPANKGNLEARANRLEQLINMLSSYEKNMGAIGKRLDSIYDKTVQTYEILQRLESQMKTRFNILEERLDVICRLLTQNALPENKTVHDVQEEKSGIPEKYNISIEEEIPEEQEIETREECKEGAAQSSQNTSLEKTPKREARHRKYRHAIPVGGVFCKDMESGSKERESSHISSTSPSTHSQFVQSQDESHSQDEIIKSDQSSDTLSHDLHLYSLFLQNYEGEASHPISAEQDIKQPASGSETNSNPGQNSREKSKRIRCDKISKVFEKS